MNEYRDKPVALTVKCPCCSKPVEWSELSSFRPFCSARCKDSDFVDWAFEKHRIAGSSDYDDSMSDLLDD